MYRKMLLILAAILGVAMAARHGVGPRFSRRWLPRRRGGFASPPPAIGVDGVLGLVPATTAVTTADLMPPMVMAMVVVAGGALS